MAEIPAFLTSSRILTTTDDGSDCRGSGGNGGSDGSGGGDDDDDAQIHIFSVSSPHEEIRMLRQQAQGLTRAHFGHTLEKRSGSSIVPTGNLQLGPSYCDH